MDEQQATPATPQDVPFHRRSLWVPLALLALAATLAALRSPGLPTATFLDQHLSLRDCPKPLREHALLLLSVPVASLIVVFVRITLGIRMLGPFRPILIAVALRQAGVVIGSLFLIAVLAVVVSIRTGLRGGWLPYFGRLSVMLAVVVCLEIAVLLTGLSTGVETLQRTSYFPIVVLCLTADGFARVLASEGPRPALWRATTTCLLALVVNALLAIPGFEPLLLSHPELLFFWIAAIMLVANRLRWGLLSHWNPVAEPRSPLD